jgi:hypothetical protein
MTRCVAKRDRDRDDSMKREAIADDAIAQARKNREIGHGDVCADREPVRDRQTETQDRSPPSSSETWTMCACSSARCRALRPPDRATHALPLLVPCLRSSLSPDLSEWGARGELLLRRRRGRSLLPSN